MRTFPWLGRGKTNTPLPVRLGFGMLFPTVFLLRRTLFFPEVMALFSGRLYDIKDRQPLTFKAKSTAAISEMRVVGNIKVSAVVTIGWLSVRFRIHKIVTVSYFSQIAFLLQPGFAIGGAFLGEQ